MPVSDTLHLHPGIEAASLGWRGDQQDHHFWSDPADRYEIPSKYVSLLNAVMYESELKKITRCFADALIRLSW